MGRGLTQWVSRRLVGSRSESIAPVSRRSRLVGVVMVTIVILWTVGLSSSVWADHRPLESIEPTYPAFEPEVDRPIDRPITEGPVAISPDIRPQPILPQTPNDILERPISEIREDQFIRVLTLIIYGGAIAWIILLLQGKKK